LLLGSEATPPQKKLLAGGRGDEMVKSYLPGSQ